MAERAVRMGGELVIAVEQPGQGWLVLNAPWPRAESYLVWRLIWQTLILYGLVLLPVLWIGQPACRSPCAASPSQRAASCRARSTCRSRNAVRKTCAT